MFKFDEELERERRNSEAVPVYHVGRGGAGNLINEMALVEGIAMLVREVQPAKTSAGRAGNG